MATNVTEDMEVTASKDTPKDDPKKTEQPKEKPAAPAAEVKTTEDYETPAKKKKKEAKPPSSMESTCIVRMAQRISWLEVEKMIEWYGVPESEMDDMDSAISLLLALKHTRMIRFERLRKALEYSGNKIASYYVDVYNQYCSRQVIRDKVEYAKKSVGQLIFFLKKELTMADLCRLSVFISYKPDKCLDFIEVIQSMTNESKLTNNKRHFLILLRKIGRHELARRYEAMDWSFLEEMNDDWFKYGIYCILDELKARDFPDYWTMDEGEIEARKGKLLEGEYSMEYNLN